MLTGVRQAQQLLDCKRSFLGEAGGRGLVGGGGTDLVVAPHPLTLSVQHLGLSLLTSQLSALLTEHHSLLVLLNYPAD